MPKKVLVVEDSESMRSLIASTIEELKDCETVEASSGFEALKVLPGGGFDLIITDINMPDINGLEVISFVRKNDQYKEIPLIIVTTEKGEKDREKGLALGAQEYVIKPFDPENLKSVVQRLMKI